MEALDRAVSFRESLRADPAVAALLPSSSFDSLFDPWQQLTEIDAIFARLGLGAESETRASRVAEAVLA